MSPSRSIILPAWLAFVLAALPGPEMAHVDHSDYAHDSAIRSSLRLKPIAALGSSIVASHLDGSNGWLKHLGHSESAWQVVDLDRHPELPIIAELPGDTFGRILDIRDGILVAVDGVTAEDRLSVFDVASPRDPILLGSLPLPIVPTDVEWHESRLYLIGAGQLLVVNVSDLTAPFVEGIAPASGISPPMATDGKVVAASIPGDWRCEFLPGEVCRMPRIVLLDVTESSLPHVISQMELPWFYSDHNPANIVDLAVRGSHVFVGAEAYPDTLGVIGIADPKAPDLIASIDAGRILGVRLDEDRLFVVGQSSIATFDMVDPEVPVHLGSAPSPVVWSNLSGLDSDGRTFLITDRGADARFLEVSAPDSLTDLGKVRPLHGLRGLHLDESILYATTLRGMFRIIDVTDRTEPRPLGYLEGNFFGHAIAVHDSVAYIAAHTRGLMVVDVSDLDAPRLIGVVDEVPNPHDLKLSGDTLFITGRDGLYSLNVSDPARPMLIYRNLISEPGLFELFRDMAYVAHKPGISVFDVSDPSRMHTTSSWRSGERFSNSAIVEWSPGTRVLAATTGFVDHSEMRVIDFNPPTGPKLSGRYSFRNHAAGLHAHGAYVFASITDSDHRLEVINVSDPTKPTLEQVIPELSANGFSSDDNTLFVANGEGLRVFDFEETHYTEAIFLPTALVGIDAVDRGR